MMSEINFLSGVKAVFFDAGGTLLFPYPSVGEVYSRVAGEHGLQADANHLNEVFRQVWHRKDALAMTAGMDEKSERKWWREIVREVFKETGGFKDFEVFFDDLYNQFASRATWKLYDETHEVLHYVKSRGYIVGMISNWDHRLLKLCDAFDIKKYFDFMLISAIYGKPKPHQDIFGEALRLSGVKPDEALHIGDSLEDDVQGATRLKIRTLWLNRHDRGHPGNEIGKIHVISNLKEMIG